MGAFARGSVFRSWGVLIGHLGFGKENWALESGARNVSSFGAREIDGATAVADLDITPLIENFREAARHLWNAHYRQRLAERDPWDVRDSFDEVTGPLFGSLVLAPLGIRSTALAPANVWEPTPVTGLIVRPSSESGVPIMINRDRPRSGYWDHPKDRITGDEAKLLLARFFDFDQLGCRDFRYLEVLIASSERHPEIAGRWALLDFEYARVFVGQPSSE